MNRAMTVKRPRTAQSLREQMAMLEAELTLKERTIKTLREQQGQLVEALIQWNRWAGRMNPTPGR